MNLELDKSGVFADLNFVDLIKASEYKCIPPSTGIYVLLNIEMDVIYVGKSVNLFKRIYQHIETKSGSSRFDRSKKIREETEFITYCEIPLSIEIDIFETLLIDYFKPVCNVDKLYLGKTNESKHIKSKYIKGENIEKNKRVESAILKKKEEDMKKFDVGLKTFLIDFFKANKGVNVSIQTLKTICENNGYETNVIGTCFNLMQLKKIGVVYEKGYFKSGMKI